MIRCGWRICGIRETHRGRCGNRDMEKAMAVVTGANGFLGAALCRELSVQGIDVIAVVNKNVSNINDISNVRVIYCDLSNYQDLPELIGRVEKVDVFYHLAWAGTSGALRGDVDVQLANIKASCEAVAACKAIGCRRFVFAGSMMEYEIDSYMQTAKMPARNTLYCTAKLSADYMARTIANDYGIEYIRTVISNVYGPGEYSARLINSSIRKMLKGEHCAFSSGEQFYDFIYLDDAVGAFIAVGKSGINNKTYYIGNAQPRRLKEFLCELRDIVNPELAIGLGEIPFNGVSLSYKEVDTNSVALDTGFVPCVDFATGIHKTVEWIRRN